MQWSSSKVAMPPGAAGSGSTKIRLGASGLPSTDSASGGVPDAAVPGSIVHAVSRTESNAPRSTTSHPEIVSPSSTSCAPGPPVNTHSVPGEVRMTGRWPGPARTSSATTEPGGVATAAYVSESASVIVAVGGVAASVASRPDPPCTTFSLPETVGGSPSRSRL